MKIIKPTISILEMQSVSAAFLASFSTAEIKNCCFNKTILFSFSLKQQYLIFAVENDTRKAVETPCISKIDIVGFNFYAQNVLFPYLLF